MKSGMGGLTGKCVCAGLVWGTSTNMPTLEEFEGGDIDSTGKQLIEVPYDSVHFNRTYSSDDPPLSYDVPVSKEVRPELWTRGPETAQWFHKAAKVPATFPGRGCEAPAISSATDGGDGTWEADLGLALVHKVIAADPDAGIEADEGLHIAGWTYLLGSRACYMDGKQVAVVYRGSGRMPFDRDPYERALWGGFGAYPSYRLGDVWVCDIATQQSTLYFLGSLDGLLPVSLEEPSYDPLGPTNMEGEWFVNGQAFNNLFPTSATYQPPVNAVQFGTKQVITSTYSPGVTSWMVARVGYSAPRILDGSPPGDHPDVFCADFGTVGPGDGLCEGDYAIMLPACREYIDSSVHSTEDPDTCWVSAIRRTSLGNLKVVTAKWHSKVFRSGHTPGSDDEKATGAADGSLHDDEVAAGNVIIDADDPPEGADFSGETWENFRLLCYNRVWDAVERKNVDLLLFDTSGPPTTVSDVVADFEDPDTHPDGINYLDHGLPNGMGFDATGTNGNKWITDPAENHTSGGSQAARTSEQDVTKEGYCDLKLTFNATAAGEVKFWYMFDNRKYGVREAPWGTITNFPEVDNDLRVYINGVLTDFTIDGDPYTGGVIDNVNVPDDNPNNDEAWYLTWRQVVVPVAAGTNTLKISMRRVWQDNGHLVAWVDDVELPEIMVGEDIEGRKRWYYDGYQVRKLKHFAWAKYDEQSATELTSRAATMATFITMDGSGRVLYGNCHFLCRTNRDGTLDTTFGGPRGPGWPESSGFVRWSASPNPIPDPEPCFDPDAWAAAYDIVSDPPWGATQFLPVGRDTIQARGMNGDGIRDATEYPIDQAKYLYKHPITGKVKMEEFRARMTAQGGTGNNWAQRAQGWTISKSGKILIPHVEIIWRPTKTAPSWPEQKSEWVNPPYRDDFETSTVNTDWAPASTRPHHPLQLPPGEQENKARWGLINYIISRTYSDAWTRTPQTVWVRMIDDPPQDEVEPGIKNPFWWDPNWSPEQIATALGVGSASGGPYNSARWRLVQARWNPNGFRYINYLPSNEMTNVCEVNSGEEEPNYVLTSIWRANFSTNNAAMFGITDFDAVDEVCCGD